MSDRLPRLLDKKMLADELGVSESVAETVMRRIPKHRIGRRVFVDRADVSDYMRRCKVTAEGYAA